MKTSVRFFCKGQSIEGKFYAAAGPSSSFPTVLLLQGFPGNEEDVLGLGEQLSLHRINTFTFNYRGTYKSEGRYSLKNTLEDIEAAYRFLQDEQTSSKFPIDSERLILGGWSYGGGMGLIHTANHPEVDHVFSIAGTDHGEFAREYLRNEAFSEMVDLIFEELKFPSGPVRFSGKTAIRNELIQNPEPFDLTSHTAQLVNRDVLLMGGWDDQNVIVENHVLPCYRRLKELGSDKVGIEIFQDSHAFDNSRSKLVEIILSWIGTLF